MFLIIVIIVIGACASILWSIYYNTISIQKSYGTVNWYYWAYYWAISSIERWLLMSKLKYPTYVGSWWFKWSTIYWAQSNWFSWEFWKLNQWNNSLTWSVNSLTTHISGVIDTKTIRAISFYTYNNSNSNSYSGWNINWTNWISKNLSFSWHTGTGRVPNTTWNVDFDRFFWLNATGYTLRSLLTTNYQTYEEKDAPLTWHFDFKNDTKNPRPALSGQHTIN